MSYFQVYGLSPAEAIEQMTVARPHIWLGRQQHSAIELYFDSLNQERTSPSNT